MAPALQNRWPVSHCNRSRRPARRVTWPRVCELESTCCEQAATTAPSAFRIVKVQLGVDTIASVERDITSRGGAPLSGGGGTGKFTLNTLSGDYRDGGPDIMAVNYDFDAAGPAGRLR